MNILYELNRKKYLYEVTKNLGKVVETDNKIICYVDNEKLKNKIKDKKCILFQNPRCLNQEILNKYNLDKHIHYIIDYMYFSDKIVLTTPQNVHLELKHCSFCNSIYIITEGDVTLERNTYLNTVSNNEYSVKCAVKNLRLVDEDFFNIYYYDKNPMSYMIDLTAESIMLKDFCVRLKLGKGNISLCSDIIDVQNAGIDCIDSVKIIGDKINIDNSSFIKSDTEVIIEEKNNNNKNNNLFALINAPKIVYNGKEFMKQEPEEKQILRSALINQLNKIRYNADLCVDEEVCKYKEQLNNKEISKILKK